MKRLFFITIFLSSLCSCLIIAPQRAKNLFVESGYARSLKNGELLLGSLTVEKGFDSHQLEANASFMLGLMLEQRNQQLPLSADSLLVQALIKEEEFTRDFKTLNTVTVELSIYDPRRGEPVALALYSETTVQTIESYAYLHSLIRRTLHHLTR